MSKAFGGLDRMKPWYLNGSLTNIRPLTTWASFQMPKPEWSLQCANRLIRIKAGDYFSDAEVELVLLGEPLDIF